MRRILPVVGVVVVVLVLGFVVLGSCSGDSKADQYRSYVQDVNSVARQSNNDARALDAALYNQELTPNQVTTRVAGFIPRARAAETTAASLKPPGKIKQQELQRYLLQALQYRTLALQDLQAALRTALAGAPNTPATEAQRRAVANAYSELVASDVAYAASFQRPAQAILKEESVTDAPITSSVWSLSPELANPSSNGNGLWIESVRDAGKSSRARTAPSAPRSTGSLRTARRWRRAPPRRAGHDRQAQDPEHVRGHGREPRQLPGARRLGAPDRGQRAAAERRRSSRSCPTRP